MHKNKKLSTDSQKEPKRTLRIAQSPKKITKLKLTNLVQISKQKELEIINEVVGKQIDAEQNLLMSSKTQHANINPYQSVYQSDMNHWKEYCESSEKYQFGGINLKWPYYFTSHQHSNKD